MRVIPALGLGLVAEPAMVATARPMRPTSMTTTISNAQRAILTAACTTDDRLVRPKHVKLKGGATGVVLTSMLKRGLVEEVAAGEDDYAWWSGEGDKLLALKVTSAGCEAVGVGAAPVETQPPAAKTFRAGTKQATLIALLQRKEGATLDEMVAATGWLSHTVRGAMAGALKKRLGMEITSEKVEGRGRVYRAASEGGQTRHS
jgi:hypothetical protein